VDIDLQDAERRFWGAKIVERSPFNEDSTMSSTAASTLTLPCKDCHEPVNDSENNAYRLVNGVLYGWCNECFNKYQHRLKHESLALSDEAVAYEDLRLP
jgi:hypothetical protein